MCARTAQQCVRFCEAHGLFDTFNTLTRQDGDLLRDSNVYFLRGAYADAPLPPLKPEKGNEADRSSDRLRRCAALLGLVGRPWGLNATPLSPRLRPRAARNLQPVPT
jgi:hypothetical protein